MKHIAIAGLGVVGGGVAEILLKNAALLEKNAGEKIVLKAIYTRTPKKDGPFAPYFVSDFSAIEQDPEIDLVVETIGGSTVALDFVSRALKAGKHVVTANKQLIAEHGLELFALAKANGVNILFEASVAGGIPVLNPLTRCLGANEITEVSGILNGTTNYILTQMLENAKDDFDYIFIDCPPSLELLTLNALCAADQVLIPVQCEYYALEGLSDLMVTLRAVKKRLNPTISIFGVLLTMYDGRTNFSAQVAEEVRRHFPGKVFAAAIPRNVRLSEAPSHGMPVCAYDKFSRGAAAYDAVAQEILAKESD